MGEPFEAAIVGMACMFPKAPDLPGYWQNILNKVDAIEEVPRGRWDWKLYYHEDRRAKDKINSKWGGFLPDTPFEPLQFGMPPQSLRSIEPLQLLLLKCVRAALDDSGYLDRPFDRSRTAVIIGAGGDADLAQRYSFRAALPGFFGKRAERMLADLGSAVPEWTEDTLPGVLTNVAAGRVSNRFDLGGSSYAVDAACASSMAALRAGFLELRFHESDMVIVGGADTIMNPYAYTCFSKIATLSPSGRSRPFDEKADGIVLSEGIAAVILKRLEDAESAGDRIYAILKGLAASGDGKATGLAAPGTEGQLRVLRRAYEQAAVSPATVGLIEAHATGTELGDRTECNALNRLLADAKAEPKSCALGSVKSMIGHPKRASGLAGFIKATLALHHKVLPPTIGVEDPIREVRSPETPLFVNTALRPWIQGGGRPRRAGVNSFGFGGVNFHAVLEEHLDRRPGASYEAAVVGWASEVLVVRGPSRSALAERVEWLREVIQRRPDVLLKDLAFSLSTVAPKDNDRCLAVVCSSLDDLQEKLSTAHRALVDTHRGDLWRQEGIYYRDEARGRGKIAFLYPGQGSQYCGMLAPLLIQFPLVRGVFECFDDVLLDTLGKPLSRYVYPPCAFSEEESRRHEAELMRTNIAQAAMGAADLAMHKLLGSLGVRPDIVAGHSYGEYVALHAAGAFSEEVLALLSEARGRFILEASETVPGTMVAVSAGAHTVQEVIEPIDDVWVANRNAPEQTVISGTTRAVERAVEALRLRGLAAVRIPTACAFHSPLVRGAQEKLGRLLRATEIREPAIPVFSNTMAGPYPKQKEEIVDLLVNHTVRPVDFIAELERMYEAGATVFVEVGAGNVLTGLVGKILGRRPHAAVALDRKGGSSLEQLQHAVAQLAAEGVRVDGKVLYEGRRCRHVLGPSANPDGRQAEASSRTAWIVNGGRAAPVTETAGEGPAPLEAAPLHGFPAGAIAGERTLQVAQHEPQEEDSPNMQRSPYDNRDRNPDADPPGDPTDRVILEFQQLMQKFLDTQKRVMLAYLQGKEERPVPLNDAGLDPAASGSVLGTIREEFPATGPASPPPVSPDLDDEFVTAEVFAGGAAPHHREGKGGVPVQEITETVLSLVEERTGYPRDVLDLDLDLDADLGLDSIKKVEILATLRERFEARAGRPMRIEAEQAAQVRTLRAVVDLVCEEVGEGRSPVGDETGGDGVGGGRRGIAAEEITETILSLVEERTGYPQEVLDLDLDLDADLGLDSIKKVEILAALRERFEARAGRPMRIEAEQAAQVRTLRAVVDLVCEEVGEATEHGEPVRDAPMTRPVLRQEAPEVEADALAPQETTDIRRFLLEPVERPLVPEPLPFLRERTVLVSVGPGDRLARSLVDSLRGMGYRVVSVQAGGDIGKKAEDAYEANLERFGDLQPLVAQIRKESGPIGGLIHLVPLASGMPMDSLSFSGWKHRIGIEVKSLFYLAKLTGDDLRASAELGGGSLLAATGMGGAFASVPSSYPASGFFPGSGGVAGFVKALAEEWPGVNVRCLDLDPSEPCEILRDQILGEFTSFSKEVEVGYRFRKRLTLALKEDALGAERNGRLVLDPSCRVMITGGARGITSTVALELARLFQPTLLLVGRSAEPGEEAAETRGIEDPKQLKSLLFDSMMKRDRHVKPVEIERAYRKIVREREIRSNLNEMRALGSRVIYLPSDVRDPSAFGPLIDRIYEEHGRIDGVVHGAGIIEDKTVLDKDPESFDRVLDTKVDSLFVLSRKIRPESLRFFTLFSSVAGRFGNRGQADYGAANEIYNKMAVFLDGRWPQRVISFLWGPWENTGMVSREVHKKFLDLGIHVIPRSLGPKLFVRELVRGKKPQVEVLLGNRDEEPRDRPTSGGEKAFPLLAVNTRVKPLANGALELFRRFDRRQDVYLEDHRLDGRPVVPMAIVLELIAEVVAYGWPAFSLQSIEELNVLKGIVLRDEPEEVRVVATPTSRSPEGLSVDVHIVGPKRKAPPHYRAQALLTKASNAARPHEPLSLREVLPIAMTTEHAYRKWLFQGPTFQGIHAVEQIARDGVIATLKPSLPAKFVRGVTEAFSWIIDPLIIDSGLQLVILWMRSVFNSTPLPSRFTRYDRFASAPVDGSLRCEARMHTGNRGRPISADLFFVLPGGNLYGVLEGLEVVGTEALNRLSGNRS